MKTETSFSDPIRIKGRPPERRARPEELSDDRFRPKGTNRALRKALKMLGIKGKRLTVAEARIDRIARTFNWRLDAPHLAGQSVRVSTVSKELRDLARFAAALEKAIASLGDVALGYIHRGWFLDQYSREQMASLLERLIEAGQVDREEAEELICGHNLLRGHASALGLPDYKGFAYPDSGNQEFTSRSPDGQQFYLAPKIKALAIIAKHAAQMIEAINGRDYGGNKNLLNQMHPLGPPKAQLARDCAELAIDHDIELTCHKTSSYFKLVSSVYFYARRVSPKYSELQSQLYPMCWFLNHKEQALNRFIALIERYGYEPSDESIAEQVKDAEYEIEKLEANPELGWLYGQENFRQYIDYVLLRKRSDMP